jgi:hypothetical protein
MKIIVNEAVPRADWKHDAVGVIAHHVGNVKAKNRLMKIFILSIKKRLI